MGEFDKPKNERSAWDSPVGTRSDGTSSLDAPTGTKKYSLAAPSAGDRAAKRERKTNDLIDRNLQRAMRTGTPQQRVAAGIAYQERSRTPGYQQGGGIQSAEGNRNRDRKTADNFTKEGLRLEGKENPAEVIAGQVDATKKPGIGTATADGGKSKIGTSAADGGYSKIGTARADTPALNARPSTSATTPDKYGSGSAQPRSNMNYIPERDGASTGEVGDRMDGSPAAPADASGRPRVTGQFEPGSELDKAEKNIWSKDPKPDGIGSPDKDGNITMTMDFRDSDKNGVDDKEDWLKRNPDYFNTGKGAAGGAGGSSSTPAGQGATPGSTTPPVAPGVAGKGKPAPMEWETNRKNAIEEQVNNLKKQKFGQDILDGETGRGRNDVLYEDMYKYGETLGISREEVDAQIKKGEGINSKNTGKGDSIAKEYRASEKEMAEPQTDSRMPTRSAKEPTPEEAKAASATAKVGKAYGAYLNGDGKKKEGESDMDWTRRNNAKYDELKGAAGLTVKPGDGGMEMPVSDVVKERIAAGKERVRLAGEKAGKEVDGWNNSQILSYLSGQLPGGRDPGLERLSSDVSKLEGGIGNNAEGMLGVEDTMFFEGNSEIDRAAIREPGDSVIPRNSFDIKKTAEGIDAASWFDSVGRQNDLRDDLTTNTGQYPREIPAREPSPTKEVVPETGGPSPEKQIKSPSSIGGKYSGKEYNTSGTFGGAPETGEHFLKTMFRGANTPPTKLDGSGFPTKGSNSPDQASVDNKLQQHHASIEASKGVLQGARKITDDIWGSDYNTVPA